MTLFAANFERVYFICALSLIASGGLWLIHRRHAAAQLPWIWLAAFAIGQGVSDLIGLGTLPAEHALTWDVLRALSLAGSLAALVEFGRRGLVGDNGPVLSVWFHVPLVGLAAAGILSGSFEWLDTTCRWALGWPGGILAMVVLLRAAKSTDGRLDRAAAATAVALAAYIVVGCTPFQLPRMAVALAMVVTTWSIVRRELPTATRIGLLGRKRTLAAFAAVVLVAWLSLGATARTDIAIEFNPADDAPVEHTAAVEIAMVHDYETPTSTKVWRYTVIALPFVIFLLLFWVGSRLPFVDS